METYDAVIARATQLWPKEPAAAMSLLEQAAPWKGWPTQSRFDILKYHRFYVVHHEWHERMKVGYPPYHSKDMGDLFFRFTQLDRYRKSASAAGSAIDAACADFAMGNSMTFERIYQYMPPNHIAASVRLTREFFRELNAVDPSKDMPPVRILTDIEGSPRDVVFLACDQNYLRFAIPLMASIRKHSPNVPIHLHLMDADPKALDDYPWIADGVSVETPEAGPGYYHAARFIRAQEWMSKHSSNLWMFDVDAIVNRPLEPMLYRMIERDVAFRARPGRLEPWNQINASVVGFSYSGEGMNYLLSIAQYIRAFIHLQPWGLDQLAMYAVWDQMRPKVKTLGEKEVGYEFADDEIVWCCSGRRKFDPTNLSIARFLAASSEYTKGTTHHVKSTAAAEVDA